MKQTDLNRDLSNRRTRKRVVPDQIEAMMRIHMLRRQWIGPSDVAMEDALHDVRQYRDFAGLGGMSRLPDRVSVRGFQYLLEEHKLAEQFLKTVNAQLSAQGYLLKEGTAADVTLIAAPSSTENKSGERDPEMHQTKKGNEWYFGMKAHIGVDADSGFVRTVEGTAANISDVAQDRALVHSEESQIFGDAGYHGVEKREERQDVKANWHVATRPGKRRALDKDTPMGKLRDEIERAKARIRTKVQHPFRVIKRQFSHVKMRYRGLMKNTQQLHTLFAWSNLWMVRRQVIKESQA